MGHGRCRPYESRRGIDGRGWHILFEFVVVFVEWISSGRPKRSFVMGMLFSMRVRTSSCRRWRASRCRRIGIIVGLEFQKYPSVLDFDSTPTNKKKSVKTHVGRSHLHIVTMSMSMSLPSLLAFPFLSHHRRLFRRGLSTPIPMTQLPSLTLTSLTTILGLPTPPTFREFPGKSLPLTTLHVGTLSNSILSFVLSARIAHDYPGPVLDFVRVTRSEFIGVRRSVSEGFDEGEHIRGESGRSSRMRSRR